jgi:hypothetical protein
MGTGTVFPGVVFLFSFKFLGVGWDWIHLVYQPLFGMMYQPQMIDEWNEKWQEKRSTRRKPAPVSLCPPQIPHDLTWAATVGSQWLTTWAMAWPSSEVKWQRREADHSLPSSVKVNNGGAVSAVPHSSSLCGTSLNIGTTLPLPSYLQFWL